MAKLRSFIKIEGTVGDLTFYKQKNGEYVVKNKGGISKERIAKDPAFARTRENGSEFGIVASAGKKVRLGASSLINSARDTKLNNRLVGVLTKVKNYDTNSRRGERQVSIGLRSAEGQALLNGFDFNGKSQFGSVLRCPFSLDTTTKTFSMADFIPGTMLYYPQSATHVSFKTGVLLLNFETGSHGMQYSKVENFPLDMNAVAVDLAPEELPVGEGFVFWFILIEFFQEINGVQYPLNNEVYNVLNLLEVTE
ncbi:hypothetical protein J2X31_000984 [Flavobacterium arsenatis]|uniref:Uncharacterized protein n=1 Tax=Flavobacterium arsenatis TaxID=1484332 RepID=A0ABU1TLY9_9FLAO|nr:hypothetical protein [Flavobacterium arsenatis]MDR6966984.1 hypothetical protein [Flavobacterium arsenatis]